MYSGGPAPNPYQGQQPNAPPPQPAYYPNQSYPQGYPPNPGYPQNPGFSQSYPPQPGYVAPPAYGIPVYDAPSGSFPPAPASGPILLAPVVGSSALVKFPKPSPYRDVAFSIVFGISTFAVFLLAVLYGTSLSRMGHVPPPGRSAQQPPINGGQWAAVLVFSLVFALVLNFVIMFLIRKFPTAFVVMGMWFTAGVLAVGAFIAFASGSILGGIILVLFLILHLAFMWFSRSRIAFAASNLRIVVTFLYDGRFSGIYGAALGCIGLYTLYFILWSFAFAVSVYSANQNGGATLWRFLLVLNILWVGQVFSNMLHVTVSGSFGHWYFFDDAFLPANPTMESFKRASGPSFGSICFGSLVVAIIQVLKLIVSTQNDQDNTCCQIFSCLLRCILQMFEDILRYINRYAFSRIGIYGQSYCEAGKETWRLISERGLDMVINDDLINSVCVLTSFISSLFVFAFAVAMCFIGWKGKDWVPIAFCALLLAFWVCNIMMTLIQSSVATLFVAFAEEPFTLARTRPTSFAELQQSWMERYGDKISHVFVRV